MQSLFDGHAGPRIAIVAGEASGDQLGASLIEAIKRRVPNARFAGIAGPRMQSAGAKSLFAMEKLAVRGYLEVIKHLRELLGIRAELRRACLAEKPDLFIGIDAPDFNLGLERKLKDGGITTIHYCSPSIWAWRGERIHKIKAATDEVLCLFPFEKPLYDEVGAKATYVGHPMADEMPLVMAKETVRETLGLPERALIFTLLPGSRVSELNYHADLFIETARLLHARYPEAQFLVPLVTRETRDQFDTARYRLKALDLPLRLMFGHSLEAMQAADAILVASGTATLEAMLAKRPMVIAYRLSETTYKLVKKKLRLPYVGLPNVLAGRFVVPELLQADATPANLAQALSNFIDDKRLGEALDELFSQQHAKLKCDAAERAADAVVAYLKGRQPC
ncbi:lipid-A-disaccharide synthase [Chitinimonas arctica]|uniref:Lipid-A-disaccharide synthase n=1 Tax=Chitinimonas arctica TaxID=2594795 RepID=A0A516SAQ6_9NEIS|nr:lipid-A-disaccharide synthase [Chitinimonas arctica]QDQ25226.1 lipid-A-disaccharide synthase [Chitinimonas arctica]